MGTIKQELPERTFKQTTTTNAKEQVVQFLFCELCVSHQEVDVPEGGRTNIVLLPSAHCIVHEMNEGRVRLWDQYLKHQIFPKKKSFT